MMPAESEAAIAWRFAGTLAVTALARAVAEDFCATRSARVAAAEPAAVMGTLAAIRWSMVAFTLVVRAWMGAMRLRASSSLRAPEALATTVPALVAATTASEPFSIAVVAPPV